MHKIVEKVFVTKVAFVCNECLDSKRYTYPPGQMPESLAQRLEAGVCENCDGVCKDKQVD